MPIISNHTILGYSEKGEIIIDCYETCLCPECQKGILKYRCRTPRHIRKEDSGAKEWYLIPVAKCDNQSCGRRCRLLPDFMVPFKHYEQEAILDVLDEVITEEDSVDCPSAQTMRRWIAWLAANLERIEGVFRSIGCNVLEFSEDLLFSKVSLLEHLRQKSDQWLRTTVRFIYNSGYQLIPI